MESFSLPWQNETPFHCMIAFGSICQDNCRWVVGKYQLTPLTFRSFLIWCICHISCIVHSPFELIIVIAPTVKLMFMVLFLHFLGSNFGSLNSNSQVFFLSGFLWCLFFLFYFLLAIGFFVLFHPPLIFLQQLFYLLLPLLKGSVFHGYAKTFDKIQIIPKMLLSLPIFFPSISCRSSNRRSFVGNLVKDSWVWIKPPSIDEPLRHSFLIS